MKHPEIAERAKEARSQSGLTQADVAYESRRQFHESFRLTQTKVARIEKGEVDDPVDLLVYATIVGCQLSDLMPEALNVLDDLRTLLERTPGCITEELPDAELALA